MNPQRTMHDLLDGLDDTAPLWATTERAYTVGEMRAEIDVNSELARGFFSDALRVARDKLAREARASGTPT